MNETQKIKIQRFLNDEVMAKTVFDILFNSFMKPEALSDVNMLAASRIAINLLQEAWDELSKYKEHEDDAKAVIGNVGL